MPTIEKRHEPTGFTARADRLALRPLINEAEAIVTGFHLLIEERRDANGARIIRQMIDERFDASEGWTKIKSGGIDWTRSRPVGDATVRLGIEIQMSARSDLMIVDVDHLRAALVDGRIDLGLMVVSSARLRPFLTDRVGDFRDAELALRRARAEDHPIAIWGISHDGIGPALAKQRTRQGRAG